MRFPSPCFGGPDFIPSKPPENQSIPIPHQIMFYVLELSWNCESTILSAVCVDESANQPCVLIWTTANYHWYLKQKLNLCSPVVALHWDETIGNLVHILLVDGTYLAHQWVWTVDHSAGISPDDLGVVAVIDGFTAK
ncbi:hypothetical protein J6590_064368 [Homalodisca vitripennis]|nr:hypothetical protein J6590_064368 [Homalodisca vitripennis]